MENTSFDLRNVFGLLRRQLRLIAITVLVIMAVASVVIFTLTPVFTASTLVLVDTSRKNLLDLAGRVELRQGFDHRLLRRRRH